MPPAFAMLNALAFLRSELVSLLFEALLFGCFSILYPISLWILLYKHKHHRSRYTTLGKWLCGMVTVMYLLAMAHLILVAFGDVAMYADHSITPDGPILFLISGKEDNTTSATVCILAAVSLVGDCFMTYRVLVILGHKWKSIALPTSLILGTLVTMGLMQHEAQSPGFALSESFYTGKMFALMTTYWTLVLATNMSHLGLILGRLMYHERMTRPLSVNSHGPATHRTVARTIIQSEAVYSAAVIANLGLYLTHSVGFFVVLDMLPSLVGISFTLIITHVGFDEIKRQLDRVDNLETNLIPAVDNSRTFWPPTAPHTENGSTML